MRIDVQNEEQNDGQDNADDTDGGVLTIEIGLGAFLDGGSDFAHAVVAVRQGQNPLDGPDAVSQGDGAA